MMRHAVQVVASVDGHDRWLIVQANTIRWAWSMPRWLSPVSWAWKRSPDAKRKRGGC